MLKVTIEGMPSEIRELLKGEEKIIKADNLGVWPPGTRMVSSEATKKLLSKKCKSKDRRKI